MHNDGRSALDMTKTGPKTADWWRTSELGNRILSAIAMLAIVLAASAVGGFVFALVCVALSSLLFFEWHRMVSRTAFDTTEILLSVGFAGLMVGALFGFFWLALLAFLALGLVLEVTSEGIEREDVRWIGFGALYCSVLAWALPLIRADMGFVFLLFLFLVVWATDVGAYFAGRRFGGAKLMPSVSPNKTWSGALGGVSVAAVIAVLFGLFAPGFAVWVAVICAVVLSCISQVGDLFESWVKRLYGVKDTGGLIPGHGGFLDRVDGLVFAALPVALVVAL
ncbi:MAG: phosphatidate cytidylyltransferase [Pseudomonadota bacterium]